MPVKQEAVTIDRKQAIRLLRERMPCAPSGMFKPFVDSLFRDRDKMTIQDILEEFFANTPLPLQVSA